MAMAPLAQAAIGRKNNKALVLTGLMLGLIFAELDETIVSTAMPTIIRDLHGLPLMGWVAGIYMLSMTLFMPILGKLADLYGRKRVYLACIGLFIAGSFVCGLAQSMPMLLVGRGIQGIGAGGLMPLAMVILGDTYELEQRAKLQALFGPLMILPQLLGPTISGELISHVNWHWIFLINLPFGILTAAVMWIGMVEKRGEEKKKIDWIGAATLMLALLSLLLAPVLIETQGLSWSSPLIIGMLVLFVVLTALLIWIERRVEEPIIPLHLFRNRNVVVLSSLVFILMLGVMGTFANFPFFAQNVMGLSPRASGYLNLAFMGGAIPFSILVGFLITRVAYRTIFILSFTLPIVALILMLQFGIDVSVMYVVVAFVIMGVGLGALFGGDNLIVQESVSKEESGIALSTVQLFQSIGASIGLSVFGSLLAGDIKKGIEGIADQLPAGTASEIQTGGIPKGLAPDLLEHVKTAFSGAYHNLYVISIAFVCIAFVLCWFLKKEVLQKREDGDAPLAH
ncbi:MFS transporter [Cohnella sp. GCM10020058]|uniref:MFS transporter n=1 Tax=Cohnella sp. GCM10020058 TaxID=3317330 RepID=UPI00362ADEA2